MGFSTNCMQWSRSINASMPAYVGSRKSGRPEREGFKAIAEESAQPSPILRAAMKADCGISTSPNWRIRFLPSFCFSRSFVFAVRLPGWVRQGLHAVALLAQRQDRPEMGVGP